MEIGTGSLIVIGLIILFAYVVVGTTGFGASTVAVPLIVQLLPLTVVVPMMVVFDLCGGLLLGGRNYRDRRRPRDRAARPGHRRARVEPLARRVRATATDRTTGQRH